MGEEGQAGTGTGSAWETKVAVAADTRGHPTLLGGVGGFFEEVTPSLLSWKGEAEGTLLQRTQGGGRRAWLGVPENLFGSLLKGGVMNSARDLARRPHARRAWHPPLSEETRVLCRGRCGQVDLRAWPGAGQRPASAGTFL